MSKVKHSFTLQSLEIRKAGGITSRNCICPLYIYFYFKQIVPVSWCLLITAF